MADEGFQIALGALFGVIVVALLAASFIPKVEREEVTEPDVKEAIADVSSKQL